MLLLFFWKSRVFTTLFCTGAANSHPYGGGFHGSGLAERGKKFVLLSTQINNKKAVNSVC
jgi:hypothetical protein